MNDEAAAATPSPSAGVMERGGFYNEHSQPQQDAGGFALPWIEEAARAAPVPGDGGLFVIADYGAAQGRNSLAPMRTAIRAVRAGRGAEVPIAVTHTDIAGNDFSALVRLLESSEASYLRGAEKVFAYAAGQSFYRRLFPDGQVCLGWSSIAVHWLSAAPATIPGHIWSPRATGETLAAFAARAEEDWRTFLRHRAAEMRPGARLVVVGGGADEAGDSGADGLMDLANATLQALVAEGALSADEYRRIVIPTYNRTPAEFMAPFGEPDASGGLVLRRHALEVLPDPLWQAFERSGDTAAFAAAATDFFEAAFGPSVLGAALESRDATAGQALAQRFYAGLRQRVAADPASGSCRWRVFLMLIEKP
jgi:hypothetical protein